MSAFFSVFASATCDAGVVGLHTMAYSTAFFMRFSEIFYLTPCDFFSALWRALDFFRKWSRDENHVNLSTTEGLSLVKRWSHYHKYYRLQGAFLLEAFLAHPVLYTSRVSMSNLSIFFRFLQSTRQAY